MVGFLHFYEVLTLSSSQLRPYFKEFYVSKKCVFLLTPHFSCFFGEIGVYVTQI